MKNQKSFTLQNFLKKNLRGFTLIELAVVIAIIVLIFTIILSVAVRRETARDTRIMTSMAQIRTKAELIMVMEGSYSSLDCDYDTEMKNLCNDIDSQDGDTPNKGDVPYPIFTTSPTEYCIIGELLADYGTQEDRYCIDNDGRTGHTTSGCSDFDCINIR
ncbi:MAG: type II secretion system protein [Candidatus Nealsonbacteria bacterium]